jgi:hypothetical protein
VTELLTAAAKTLNYETWDAKNLVTGFGETLGFTVELERLTRHVDDKLEEMSLRATSIYRREGGLEGHPPSRRQSHDRRNRPRGQTLSPFRARAAICTADTGTLLWVTREIGLHAYGLLWYIRRHQRKRRGPPGMGATFFVASPKETSAI